MSTLDLEKVQAAFWNIPGIKTFGKGEQLSAQQALERAGLDWIVEQRPIMALDSDGCEIAIESHVANVRGDTQQCIGVVGKGYVPIDNDHTFGLAEAVVKQSGAHWLGGGFTHGGGRVHAVLAMDETFDLGIAGEDILPLLFVSNGHDGGLAVRLRVAPMRLACLNGMLVRTKVRHDWSARHTTNVATRVEEARLALHLVEHYVTVGRAAEPRADRQAHRLKRAFSRFLNRLVPLPHDLAPMIWVAGACATSRRCARPSAPPTRPTTWTPSATRPTVHCRP